VPVESAIALCYPDMRRLARRIVLGDGQRVVLQGTDLANEAVVRLLQSSDTESTAAATCWRWRRAPCAAC